MFLFFLIYTMLIFYTDWLIGPASHDILALSFAAAHKNVSSLFLSLSAAASFHDHILSTSLSLTAAAVFLMIHYHYY